MESGNGNVKSGKVKYGKLEVAEPSLKTIHFIPLFEILSNEGELKL